MRDLDYETKIKVLERENIKLKDDIKKLTNWVNILSDTKEKLQKKNHILECSIRNFGLSIQDDLK